MPPVKRQPGLKPAGSRLTSKTVSSPSNPVKSKPPTESGDNTAKNTAMRRQESAKSYCFVDEDHSRYTPGEMELFPTEVQLPGSNVKARVMVCLHHQVEMEALKENAVEAARTLNMAPYGRCSVCEDPVGLREDDTPLPDRAGELVPVTYWERMDKTEDVVHERCRRGYREKVTDEDGNKSVPGWHRRIVLV